MTGFLVLFFFFATPKETTHCTVSLVFSSRREGHKCVQCRFVFMLQRRSHIHL